MSDLKWKKNNTGYELRTDHLRIIVHHHIYHDPDEWLLSCYELGVEKKSLKNKDDFRARNEALELVRSKLKSMLDSVS